MNDDTTPLPLADPTPSEPAPRRSLRPIALGVIAGLATAALASGGIALASGLGAESPLVVESSPTSSPSPSGTSTATPSPSPSASPDDDLAPGDAGYAQVTAAALAAVGGGTVLEVDRGDDPGEEAWKVEILLANGDRAEVRLAADLTVLRIELDNDDHGSNSGPGSDDSGHDDSDDSGHDDSDDDSGHGGDDSNSGSGSDDSGHGGDDD